MDIAWVSVRRPALALLLVACAQHVGHAHDISRSESTLEVNGREIHAALTLNLLDFHSMPELDKNHDGRISYAELDDSIERIYEAVQRHYVVRSTVPPAQTTVERYELLDQTAVRLHIVYRFDDTIRKLEVTSTLAEVTQPDHRHLMRVAMDGSIHNVVLDISAPRATFDETRGSLHLRTSLNLVRTGIEEVFTRFDRLAFLVGLLIATGTSRSLVMVVASFTVAQSIALALATFDIVVLPARLTESLVALGIAYIAIENLFRAGLIERNRIAFLFGLVHGFGFSTVLRQMQLPRRELGLSLFSFNAGIEIGQLVFVAIVFPLVLYKTSTRWHQEVRFAVSIGAVGLSLYWFVQRAFLN
jgi:hypothetical protein